MGRLSPLLGVQIKLVQRLADLLLLVISRRALVFLIVQVFHPQLRLLCRSLLDLRKTILVVCPDLDAFLPALVPEGELVPPGRLLLVLPTHLEVLDGRIGHAARKLKVAI